MGVRAEGTTVAAVWVVTGQWINRLLGFVSLLIVARLLTPTDFGISAVAMSFIGVLAAFTMVNVNAVIVASDRVSLDLLNTAWTISVIRGILLSCLLWSSSFYLAVALNDERLEIVFRVLALVPLINGFRNPHFTLFEKELNFRPIVISSLLAKVTSVATVVVLALVWNNYWAIIASTLVFETAQLIFSFVARPAKPRPSLSAWRRIVSFAGWLTGAGILNTLSRRLDTFIVVRVLGVEVTGKYQMGRELAALPNVNIASPIRRVLFPSFSIVTSNRDHLRENVLEALSMMVSLIFPMSIGFALVAPSLVPLMLGIRWVDIVPVVQVFCCIGALQVIGGIAITTLMSCGMTRVLFQISVVTAFIRIPLVVVLTYAGGILGAVIAALVSQIVVSILMAIALKNVIEVPLHMVIRSFDRGVFSTAAMVFAIVGFSVYVPLSNGFLNLLIHIIVGGSVYLVSHFLLWRIADCPKGIERRLGDALVQARTIKLAIPSAKSN